MLRVAPPTPTLMKIIAPAMDIGTDTNMISGIAKTFEQIGQGQIDHDQRESEGHTKPLDSCTY